MDVFVKQEPPVEDYLSRKVYGKSPNRRCFKPPPNFSHVYHPVGLTLHNDFLGDLCYTYGANTL
jgi:hypothetical protein